MKKIYLLLKISVVKNRYGRDHTDKKGSGVLYNVDWDTMRVTHIPDLEEIKKDDEMNEIAEEAKTKFKYAF